MAKVIKMNTNFYDMISENPSRKRMLLAAGLKETDIPRYRDVDVPPYKRYRQLPIFTDTRFIEKNLDTNKNSIIVLTRAGGECREYYKDWWENIKKNPNYVIDYDSNMSTNYAFIEFSCNEYVMNELKKLDNNPEPDIDRIVQIKREEAIIRAKAKGIVLDEIEIDIIAMKQALMLLDETTEDCMKL